MSKLISLVLIGSLLALVPFFFFFIGIKIHYIDFYQIKEYYNIIFVDNIPWDIFAYTALVLGSLFVFPKHLYLGGLVFATVVGASLTMFIPTVAKDMAKTLLAKENFHIKKGKWLYSGTLLYEGRHNYYFRKDDANQTITFRKDEIDETY